MKVPLSLPRSKCMYCGEEGLPGKPETIRHKSWCAHTLGECQKDEHILRGGGW